VVGDFLLLTVGRKANTDGLGLDKTKVALDNRGQIIVDKQMRTSVPHIFAVGDVTGPPFLAHRASKQGIVAAEVCAGMKSEADFKAIPSAVFTDPELAVVGMGEKEAVEKGLKVKVGKVNFAALGRALAAGESEGFVKIITEENSGLVLGAVIVGPCASDLISELAFAIEMGATAEDLAYTMHPHPTFPEAIMETAEAALGKAIHILNR
jgi:dihydrolipoamide dehydrogenase